MSEKKTLDLYLVSHLRSWTHGRSKQADVSLSFEDKKPCTPNTLTGQKFTPNPPDNHQAISIPVLQVV